MAEAKDDNKQYLSHKETLGVTGCALDHSSLSHEFESRRGII